MLTRKEIPFLWSEDQQVAFEILRDSLITEPLLIYPDFKKLFPLTTEASGFALGAIISQTVEKDSLPIAYASQQMNSGTKLFNHGTSVWQWFGQLNILGVICMVGSLLSSQIFDP